jgi:hypothetical protein
MVLLAGVLLLGPGMPGAAQAADIETRDFNVAVDGKLAGEVHMTIQRHDNGTIQVRCDTDIHVSFALIGAYKFIYRGHETWKDRRLQRLDSTTDDNGKLYNVKAVAEPGGLRVRVNNVERIARPEVWLTSYWSLPDPKLRSGEIPLIDADTGKDLKGKLEFVATEKRRVAGQDVLLNHYRLTGSLTVDLWYDGSERLVRQEWIEQGRHKTIMELTRVRR